MTFRIALFLPMIALLSACTDPPPPGAEAVARAELARLSQPGGRTVVMEHREPTHTKTYTYRVRNPADTTAMAHAALQICNRIDPRHGGAAVFPFRVPPEMGRARTIYFTCL